MVKNVQFRSLIDFSNDMQISKETLIKAFKIERVFHEKILKESRIQDRIKLYEDVYTKVHQLYRDNSKSPIFNPKTKLAFLLRNYVKNKSVLDIGCGQGDFLKAINDLFNHKKLLGIDLTAPKTLLTKAKDLNFRTENIIRLELNEKFNTIISDNVLEHIAPSDIPFHLRSIYNFLEPKGYFIILMPNRLFGPSDITRIIDYSYSGSTPALGTHINESCYTDMFKILKVTGFKRILPCIPIIGLKFPIFLFILMERIHIIHTLLINLKFRKKPIYKMPIFLLCQK